ncbi:MAG: carbohydrate kinase [Planctomycetes bacterium]|nr:carbohydrate kinase [Planctomycetota bacterium]
MSQSRTSDKTIDLVSLGDLMIDFTCLGNSDSGQALFERNPGGGPMNVAAQVARLGGKAAVIASVGADEHGEYLRDTMRSLGVNADNVSACAEFGTRMLFVYFKDGHERYFTDYRGPRSDLQLSARNIDYDVVANAKVMIYAALCNIYDQPIYEAKNQALAVARRHGALVAFDANFRFPYEDDKLRRLDMQAIREAHIVKLTQEEFAYYLNEPDIMRGSEELLAGNARIVAVSMGRNGSFIRTRKAHAYRPAYQVEAVDTTGAGDSFMGSLIYRLTRPGVIIDDLGEDDLGGIAEFANACAGASTTKRGSLLVMPTRAEAERVMLGATKHDTALETALANSDIM